MPKCNRCSSTSVVWGETKAGHPFLVEVRPPIPHSQFCSAQKGKLAKKPKVSPEDEEMQEALLSLGWDIKKVKRLLPHAKGDTFEARFRAALAYADKESA